MNFINWCLNESLKTRSRTSADSLNFPWLSLLFKHISMITSLFLSVHKFKTFSSNSNSDFKLRNRNSRSAKPLLRIIIWQYSLCILSAHRVPWALCGLGSICAGPNLFISCGRRFGFFKFNNIPKFPNEMILMKNVCHMVITFQWKQLNSTTVPKWLFATRYGPRKKNTMWSQSSG